ncbi:MAG: response regulator [Fibrobacterota bacterium]|nr:response regulator [Fibrobacterota bacterium]QQS05393.1 MAG: response regulator [Fibrobacterota bacterium]
MPREKLKILVVDDEPLIVEVFREMLGQKYEVHTAHSAVEVQGALEERTYDVLITDWSMPGLNGLSLARRMGAAGRCWVMLITGADEDAILGVANEGFSVHRKPIRWRALLDELKAVEERVFR